jgi:hypothetical protein
MKFIFYRVVLFNGKNKKVYKEESSLKLYCKLNGKMIDIKKYKKMCKKPKTQKSKKNSRKK